MSVLGERTGPESITTDEDETPDLSPVSTDEDETDESPDEDPPDFLMEAAGVAIKIDKETSRLLLVLAFALLMARIMYD
jgi:hypothetical protein